MAEQRKQPSTDARRALWEAWNERSAYSSEPVPYAALHIDHVIPLDRPDLASALVANGLLPTDFDLNGFENLLPVAAHENLAKGADPFDEGVAVYYAQRARDKKPRVQEILERNTRSIRALGAYLTIKSRSERNEISIGDAFAYMAHEFEGKVPLKFSPGVEGSEIASANSAMAGQLLNKPFALGDGTINEVILTKLDQSGVVKCKTSNEFIKGIESGAFPYTQADITIASMAYETTNLLLAIRDSKYAPDSALREPLINFSHLDRWAAEWIVSSVMEPEERERFGQLGTVSEAIEAGACAVLEQGPWEVFFDIPHGIDLLLRELMRADLDGDGNEEILVFYYNTAARVGGTLRAGTTIMAKVGADGLLHMHDYGVAPPAEEEP